MRSMKSIIGKNGKFPKAFWGAHFDWGLLFAYIAQRASTLNFFNTVIGVFAMHLYLAIDS